MKIIIRQARIIDPSSPHHLQPADIWITDGIIRAIRPTIIEEYDLEIAVPELCVSPGWVDIFAHFNDPGFEYRETIETGAAAAASGGFTNVFLLPNTSPVVHNKSAVEYITQKSKNTISTLHPIGAITKNTDGKELAEMYDMYHSGALCFSDGLHSVQSSGVLLKALQYVKAIEAVIIQLPDDKSFASNGLMNEGIMATQLGLAGKPSLGEELLIARDIELLRYTNSKLHITGISSAKSIQLIRAAKSEGLKVTCSVTPYHLYFIDEDLNNYDTNLKVNTPLRTADDRAALQEAVLDGTVDCIAAHHLPYNSDEKEVEFEKAENGMIGLQTSYAVVKTCLPQITLEQIGQLFSTNARAIFGLPKISIKENNEAALTLFFENKEWIFTESHLLSRSKNSPFIGKSFRGKPYGIINKDKVFLNE